MIWLGNIYTQASHCPKTPEIFIPLKSPRMTFNFKNIKYFAMKKLRYVALKIKT